MPRIKFILRVNKRFIIPPKILIYIAHFRSYLTSLSLKNFPYKIVPPIKAPYPMIFKAL